MANMKTGMLTKLLLGLIIALSVVGCGKMQQDPLDGNDKVTEGTKKPEVDQGAKPVPSDLLRIDTVQFYSFEAGKADEFKITARVMVPDYDVNVSIENLAEFQGATYEPATGVFKWTPPNSIVTSPNLSADLTLNIRVVSQNFKQANQAVHTRSQSVPIKVFAKLEAPLIVSALAIGSDTIKEGSNYNVFNITVRDSLANEKKESWPTISFIAVQGSYYQSLAPFVAISSASRNANGDIVYSAYVNLLGVEVTNITKKFEITMVATSIYGKSSAEKTISYNVTNTLDALSTTWVSTYFVKPGGKYDFAFVYFNKKSEGYVNKPTFSNLPAGSVMNCSGNGSIQTCKFEWSVPATATATSFIIGASVETWAAQNSSIDKISNSFNHVVQVLAAPVPFRGQ